MFIPGRLRPSPLSTGRTRDGVYKIKKKKKFSMSVFETIKRRHSIGKMTNQVPARAHIEQIIEAATHAPNHRKVEPWRFFVLAGTAREELGEIMAQSLANHMEETSSE